MAFFTNEYRIIKINYFQELMGDMRLAISENTFDVFEKNFYNCRADGDIEKI